ncbi:hypothetical protein B0H14DRAFT_3869168 [Mycena olivaceomarginata]|nr:hypothetical protein B0H14DRAFT_3869168 [Mycena olivaceomarginata]
MRDDDLSATSEEEDLTPAEKARKTRAKNLAIEAEENKRRAEETSHPREAKKTALKNKVWDTSSKSNVDANNPRKRAASSATTDQKPKKTKSKGPQQETDQMDVDEEPPVSSRPKTSKTAPAKKAPVKMKPTAPKASESARRRERPYLPASIQSSDDESPAQLAPKPSKSLGKKASAPAVANNAPAKSKEKAKKTSKAASDEGEAEDSEPSLSSDEQKEESAESQSGLEEEDSVDIPHETAQMIKPTAKVIQNDDPPFDDEDDEELKPRCHRAASSSSFGSMPPDTDFDNFDNVQDGEDDGNPASEGEDEIEEVEPVKGRKKSSAQQLKYDQEKSVIRSSKALPASNTPSPETDWHQSARIVFPANGGVIKLLQQNDPLKGIIRSAIALHLYRISFEEGYEPNTSRSTIARRVLRLAAKKDPRGSHIQARAKNDLAFCGRLATLILTRGTSFRSTLRTIAASKVAGYYELNKPGITPSQIRAIVKQLIDNQQFILPYGETAPCTAAAADSSSATPHVVEETTGKKDKAPKNFIATLPFHAPAIVDVLHEGWWTGPKSLGVLHVKEFKSNRADRPSEVVLPDAMICLGAVNVWSELVCYETGHYVPVKEFSQQRLESTYLSLLEVLQQQRRLASANYFNKTMHELYLKVSRSAPTAQTRGSANSVICLPIDCD